MKTAIQAILLGAVLTIAVALVIGESLIHADRQPQLRLTADAKLPPQPMEPAALAALQAFFEAPDLAGKIACVRNPRQMRPMMDDYHHQRGHPFPTLGRVSPGKSTTFGLTPCVLFEVEPFSGPRYPVAVLWDGTRFAVDWESLTAYGTVDWSEFVERHPGGVQVMRVYAQGLPATRQPPALPAGQKAFLIEHRDDPQPLVAIAGGDAAESISSLVRDRRAPLTLEMTWQPRGPGGAPVPVILRLIANGWSP
jgi:hypothetical protein